MHSSHLYSANLGSIEISNIIRMKTTFLECNIDNGDLTSINIHAHKKECEEKSIVVSREDLYFFIQCRCPCYDTKDKREM